MLASWLGFRSDDNFLFEGGGRGCPNPITGQGKFSEMITK